MCVCDLLYLYVCVCLKQGRNFCSSRHITPHLTNGDIPPQLTRPALPLRSIHLSQPMAAPGRSQRIDLKWNAGFRNQVTLIFRFLKSGNDEQPINWPPSNPLQQGFLLLSFNR